jgi:hypothetical protein
MTRSGHYQAGNNLMPTPLRALRRNDRADAGTVLALATKFAVDFTRTPGEGDEQKEPAYRAKERNLHRGNRWGQAGDRSVLDSERYLLAHGEQYAKAARSIHSAALRSAARRCLAFTA